MYIYIYTYYVTITLYYINTIIYIYIYDYNKCTYNTMYYNIYCRVTPFYQGTKSAL